MLDYISRHTLILGNQKNVGVTFLGKWSFRLAITDVSLLKSQAEMGKFADFMKNHGFYQKLRIFGKSADFADFQKEN